jgi:ABC-2 type transport system ATP-binding protein
MSVTESIVARDAGVNSTADAPAVVSIQHISKTYPQRFAPMKSLSRGAPRPIVEALHDVSFDIREGEVFGLIGRNGAGKTTLTKILATLVQPTSGNITVRGYDSVRNEEEVRRQIGLASAEERTFYWRLTVEQNLWFFARLYGMSGQSARQRISELLARFELEDSVRQRFGTLSTGNKQKMAVARAMLNSPPVLLLDEPTRSLDPLAAVRMRALIASFARATPPVTILLTSHNLAEVEELCGRIAVISRGRICASGTPAEVRALDKQQERIRLVVGGISRAHAEEILTHRLGEVEVHEEGENVVVSFVREAGDDRLDRGMRALLENGTRLEATDVERPTLLDVLESYEQVKESEVSV